MLSCVFDALLEQNLEARWWAVYFCDAAGRMYSVADFLSGCCCTLLCPGGKPGSCFGL